MPTTVQDLLEARLDALDASPRHVAHGAAVIGRTFGTRVLARVTPDEDLDPALGTLEREHFVSRVLMAEPTYSFAHALVQEVAYRTQLIAQRRRTHVVVGDAFTDLFGERIEEFIDTLAFHYRRGEDDAKAVTWLVRAGRRAQRLYANAEALDYFQCGHRSQRRGSERTVGRVRGYRRCAPRDRPLRRCARRVRARRCAIRAGRRHCCAARVRRKSGLVQQLRGKADEALDDLRRCPRAASARGNGRAHPCAAEHRRPRSSGTAKLISRSSIYRVRSPTPSGAATDDALAEALKQLGTIHGYKGELLRSARAIRSKVSRRMCGLETFSARRTCTTTSVAPSGVGAGTRMRSPRMTGRSRSASGSATSSAASIATATSRRSTSCVVSSPRRSVITSPQWSWRHSIGYAFGASASLVGLGCDQHRSRRSQRRDRAAACRDHRVRACGPAHVSRRGATRPHGRLRRGPVLHSPSPRRNAASRSPASWVSLSSSPSRCKRWALRGSPRGMSLAPSLRSRSLECHSRAATIDMSSADAGSARAGYARLPQSDERRGQADGPTR